jgi:hypothetical protein
MMTRRPLPLPAVQFTVKASLPIAVKFTALAWVAGSV